MCVTFIASFIQTAIFLNEAFVSIMVNKYIWGLMQDKHRTHHIYSCNQICNTYRQTRSDHAGTLFQTPYMVCMLAGRLRKPFWLNRLDNNVNRHSNISN